MPRRARPHTALLVIVIAVVAVVAVVVVALVAIASFPAHHTWSTRVATTPGILVFLNPPSIPTGASVQGTWSGSGPDWVNFSITNAGLPVYSLNGSGGAFAFISDGLGYSFTVLSGTHQNVSISLAYNASGWFF